MSTAPLTILSDGRSAEVTADLDGERVLLSPDAVETATGWTPKPEGLCRDDACIPLRDTNAVDDAGRLDLAGVAAALRRPLATELDGVAVAVLGDAAADRAAAMASLTAPDFELEGLDGKPVRLSDAEGHKRLLLACASW